MLASLTVYLLHDIFHHFWIYADVLINLDTKITIRFIALQFGFSLSRSRNSIMVPKLFSTSPAESSRMLLEYENFNIYDGNEAVVADQGLIQDFKQYQSI